MSRRVLAALVPHLVLMRELVNQSGTMYLRLDEQIAPYVALMADELFGKTIAVHVFSC